MKLRNGFTLIEMLAVITILGIATLVLAPSILNLLKKSENDKYENYLEDLYLAAESYAQMHIEDIPDLSNPGGTYTVPVKVLRDENFVKRNLINPKTNQNTLDTDGIKITVEEDLKHTYDFVSDVESIPTTDEVQ